MGTSSDYTGGSGRNWTQYRHAASNFARRGGADRVPTLAEKFSHIEDPDQARARYKELRERLEALVKLEIGSRDPLSVAWRDSEGEAIVTKVIDQLYEDMEDLE
jgi:hypothetical protein